MDTSETTEKAKLATIDQLELILVTVYQKKLLKPDQHIAVLTKKREPLTSITLEEMHNIFVHSLCLANDAEIFVNLEYRIHSMPCFVSCYCNISAIEFKPLDPEINIKDLNNTQLIARLNDHINTFCDSLRLKSGDERRESAISESLILIHQTLFLLSTQLKLNFFQSVCEFASRSCDETIESALLRIPSYKFQKIKDQSSCRFSKRAKLFFAPPLTTSNIEDSRDRLLRSISKYILTYEKAHFDSLVITLPHDCGNTISNLSNSLCTLLFLLNMNDPNKSTCLNQNFEDENWQFEFSGVRFFIVCLAACYPKTHSRFSFEVEGTFIIMQAESSFEWNNIPKTHADDQIRRDIRQSFFSAQRTYEEFQVMKRPIDSLRYIKPLQPNDEPIRWWENAPTKKKEAEGSKGWFSMCTLQ